MCNHCGSKTYGQDQAEARQADKEKLDKTRQAREAYAERKSTENN